MLLVRVGEVHCLKSFPGLILEPMTRLLTGQGAWGGVILAVSFISDHITVDR